MSKVIGIYKITNILDKKCYIGSSVNVKKRFSEHRRDLNKNSHHSYHLQRAWNKYGESQFQFQILEICINESALIEKEQY